MFGPHKLLVATFRVARLTHKLENFGWSVSRPTVTLVTLACVSFHFIFHVFFVVFVFHFIFCFFFFAGTRIV